MKTIVESTRLVLREITMDDLDFVAEMRADADVMRFYPQRYSRSESAAWIERMLDRYTSDGHAQWLAIDKQSGNPVGTIGLLKQTIDGRDEAEIAYLLHRPFWHQGFASEAAAATRDFAFDMLGHQRVISLIRPVNVPSQRVAIRLGMLPERMTEHAKLDHLVFCTMNS